MRFPVKLPITYRKPGWLGDAQEFLGCTTLIVIGIVVVAGFLILNGTSLVQVQGWFR